MKFRLFCFFMMLSGSLFSQENKRPDSIYLFDHAFRQLEASKKNATALLRNPDNMVSQVSLIYDHQAGSFKKSQTASSSTDISFNSEGIKQLGNFRLYGGFTYSKIKQSDLSFNLRGEDIDDEPFYFFAGKESDFSRQKYHAKGIISYGLIKDKLYLSSGFNYIYYLADRSIDPRMSLDWFDFKANPEITLKTGKFNFGISALLGYGNETTLIKYKNIDYSTGVLYPERTAYLNYGYGFIRKGFTTFSRRKQYKGGGLHVSGELGSFNTVLNVDYANSFDKNQRGLDNSLKNEVFSDYESQKINAYMLATKKTNQNIQQIEVTYSNLKGDDFVYLFSAKNYTAKNQTVYASFSNLRKYGNKFLSWGVNNTYIYSYKKDAVTDHLIEYSYFQPGIMATYYYCIPNKYSLSASILPSIILPLDTRFTAPSTQEVEFTRGILYPDYNYHKATAGNLNLTFKYINETISKDFRTGLVLNTNLTQTLNKPNSNLPAYSVLGNNRVAINLSLNLYF